jgi:hypothetical protein
MTCDVLWVCSFLEPEQEFKMKFGTRIAAPSMSAEAAARAAAAAATSSMGGGGRQTPKHVQRLMKL